MREKKKSGMLQKKIRIRTGKLLYWDTDVNLLKSVTLANRVSNAVFFLKIAVIPIP